MTLPVLTLAASLAVAQATAPTPTCSLHMATQARWEGTCGILIGEDTASLSISPAPTITTGTWRRDATPRAIWAGTVVVGAYPPTPVEIEVYDDGGGAMRTLFGWYPVARFVADASSVRLDVDTSREVTPSGIDRAIVERAAAILSSEAVWNRADNRRCPADASRWSIYCAMEKATIEVAGAFHHRRPALQVVREIVDERTAGRPYDHRLMDYNNDPGTGLGDVRTLFAEALRRIDAAQANGSR